MPSSPNISGFPDTVWSKFSPESFEHFCRDVLEAQNPDANFQITRHSHDGGVDIFSNYEKSPLQVFGSRLAGPTTMFIEVKRRKTVDINDFARSLVSAASERGCGSFVLVTSSPFNVNTYMEMSEFCRSHKLAFSYVHRDMIAHTLIDNPLVAQKWGFQDVIPNWSEVIAQPRPSIVCYWNYLRDHDHGGYSEIEPLYCTQKRRDIPFGPKEKLKIPLVISNIGGESCKLLVHIVGLDYWRALNLSSDQVSIPAHEVVAQLLVFELAACEAVRLPDLHVEEIQKQGGAKCFRATITANKLYAIPFFKAQFVGKSALQQQRVLEEFAANPVAPQLLETYFGEWLIIEGQAGVGKSRLVEEALIKPSLERSGKGVPDVRRYYAQRGDDRKIIIGVLRDISNVTPLAGRDTIDAAIAFLKQDGLTDATIEAAALVFTARTVRPLLFVLEDIHHGGDKFYRWLQAVFDKTAFPAPDGSVFRICLTGRNDDTFPNPRQSVFAESIKRQLTKRGINAHRIIEVRPLDEKDTRTLVHSLCHDITVTACNRIVGLSEHVPFNILQVIEYLCEESLVEISARRTYSIRDENLFYSKLGLPESMKDVFDLRLRNLAEQEGGTKLIQLLRSLSLLGLHTSKKIYDRLADIATNEEGKWTLFHSNYLVLDDNERVRFSHENILNFLQSQTLTVGEWVASAKAVAEHPDILDDIEEWRRCRINHIAGNKNETARIVKSVVGDGSIGELGRSGALSEKYEVLKIGIDLWSRELHDRESALFLLNLYFLWAYASKFTRHYGDTIRDGLAALDAVRSHQSLEGLVDKRTFDLACAKIEQIVGHAYQNTGNLECSMRHITSAQRTAYRWTGDDPGVLDLKFDIEDRFRKNFVIFGDGREAHRAFVSACSAARQKQDPALLGTARYGEAELHFVQDPDRAGAIWRTLYQDHEVRTDDRIKITLDLALLQVDLLKNSGETSVHECLDRLKDIRDRSPRLGLVGPLPKINLLNGFAYFLLGDFERAIQENLLSYAEAERTGYGVFLWFSQNNIALMRLNSGREVPEELVISAFETALNKSEQQGFLKHLMVPQPLFFQNALVDNARRFYDQFELRWHQATLDDRLRRNGADPARLPRENLAHTAFNTPYGIAMLFV